MMMYWKILKIGLKDKVNFDEGWDIIDNIRGKAR